MTFPIKCNSQTIELYARKGVKKLEVKPKQEAEKAVA
jgi:hypothetical protein